MKKIQLMAAVLILTAATLACSLNFNQGQRAITPAPTPLSVPTLSSEQGAIPAITPPPGSTTLDGGVLTGLYERVNPGVVSIQTSSDLGQSAGSGFVIDKEGHIVTNLHVVEGAQALEIDFSNGFKARGEVVGTDPDSDIAVIKADAPADQLFPLTLGDSDQLKVGQTVAAIGNPFRLSGTMTVGIISARGRMLESLRQAPEGNSFTAGDIIQTDAAINPGNSGGPLLNLAGEVVGINRAIRTETTTASGDPSNSGIGFAISINIVKRVVPVLISQGAYDYPYLGISSRDDLSLDLIDSLKLDRPTGAYVIEVTSGGPADQAGLLAGTERTDVTGLLAGGDLIIAADGKPIRNYSELVGYMMNNKSPGDQISLTVIRDGKEMQIDVTLGKRP
jgi:2-alkenal reductase